MTIHRSNESSLPVPTYVAICFPNIHKMKFGNLVEICFLLNLGVKGLNSDITLDEMVTNDIKMG